MAGNNRNSEMIFVNSSIRVPMVLCIDNENVNLGVIQTSKALSLAADRGLDLVQVSPPSRDRPPTCKIMDYGKYKYELSKKKKEAAAAQRAAAIKEHEIWFRPTTDINDLQTKAKKAAEFIEAGDKLRVKIKFAGREINNQSVGFENLETFLSMIPNAQFESRPSFEGKVLIVGICKKQ